MNHWLKHMVIIAFVVMSWGLLVANTLAADRAELEYLAYKNGEEIREELNHREGPTPDFFELGQDGTLTLHYQSQGCFHRRDYRFEFTHDRVRVSKGGNLEVLYESNLSESDKLSIAESISVWREGRICRLNSRIDRSYTLSWIISGMEVTEKFSSPCGSSRFFSRLVTVLEYRSRKNRQH